MVQTRSKFLDDFGKWLRWRKIPHGNWCRWPAAYPSSLLAGQVSYRRCSVHLATRRTALVRLSLAPWVPPVQVQGTRLAGRRLWSQPRRQWRRVAPGQPMSSPVSLKADIQNLVPRINENIFSLETKLSFPTWHLWMSHEKLLLHWIPLICDESFEFDAQIMAWQQNRDLQKWEWDLGTGQNPQRTGQSKSAMSERAMLVKNSLD